MRDRARRAFQRVAEHRRCADRMVEQLIDVASRLALANSDEVIAAVAIGAHHQVDPPERCDCGAERLLVEAGTVTPAQQRERRTGSERLVRRASHAVAECAPALRDRAEAVRRERARLSCGGWIDTEHRFEIERRDAAAVASRTSARRRR